MTDTYNDTTGSRKKFLIPLVVLLLCAVSLTGAGYAYSVNEASMQDNGNNVDVGSLTMDVNGAGYYAFQASAMDTDIVFYDHVYRTGSDITDNVSYEVSADESIGTLAIRITANDFDEDPNVTGLKVNITSSAETITVGGETYNVSDILPTIGVKVGTGAVTQVAVNGAASTFSDSLPAEWTSHNKDVTLTFSLAAKTGWMGDGSVVANEADAYDFTAKQAAAFVTAIQALTFSVGIETVTE